MNNVLYPSILCLEDGTIFKGWSLLNTITSIGEVVFNTGMTGYQEIMTDPSYEGQIITFTYPEIGNTGMNTEDYESKKIHIAGVVAKNICFSPSNWRSKISYVNFLLKYKIPHIFNIDTRSLTKHLRMKGVMNGCISSKVLDIMLLRQIIQKSPSMEGLDLVQKVTVTEPYDWKLSSFTQYTYSHINYKISKIDKKTLNIVVIDFGVKYNILSRLSERGCNIKVLPANSTYDIILSHKPDGILLSNGPGDPSVLKYGICSIQKIIDLTNIPIFGICMGHQILSLALGGKTFKLKFGHRGLNHPAGINQRVEITSQNHGFAVNIRSISNNQAVITHLNLNDATIAGMMHASKPIFSVQYHPEASPGPHDSDYLFTSFIQLINLIKNKNK